MCLSLREAFAYKLNELTSSQYFIKQLKEYGLEKYKWSVLGEEHRIDVLNLFGGQMTKEGGNITSIIYNITDSEKSTYNRYSHLIEHAIKSGLSIVVTDENNIVASSTLLFDIADRPKRADWSIYPLKYTKKNEFTSLVANQHTFINGIKDNINKYNLIKKGECILLDLAALRRDLQGTNKGLQTLLIGIVFPLTYSIKQIKYLIHKSTHPGSVRLYYKLDHHFNSLNGFNDNQHKHGFYTHMLDAKKFFIDKFENDEWYKNNLNKQFIMKNIHKIKIASQVICYLKLREQKMSEKQFFMHYIKAMNRKSKL